MLLRPTASGWLPLIILLASGACARQVRPEPANSSVQGVALTVSERANESDFFTHALGFERREETSLEQPTHLGMPRGVATVLSAGSEQVTLLDFDAKARPFPRASQSNDLWFQHLAIVVDDLDAEISGLERSGAQAVSRGPQTLPQSNPAAAGIRAFYFRDPDGHNLELIWYPPDKGHPRWHQRSMGQTHTLGIDHTAIAVKSTERSLAFWRDSLGLEVAGGSFNEGPEQEALSGVQGARVRITALRGREGLGVELLEYVAPLTGRAPLADLRPTDLAYWEITVRVNDLNKVLSRIARSGFDPPRARADHVARLRDPDGHYVRLIEQEEATP
jgi:catechol 2,3-dioxygenase-like lactoylglutathione lyase family enzyme